MLIDVKPLFACAVAKSEPKIVERILVSVLPELMAHHINITPEMLEGSDPIMVPEALYLRMIQAAESLTGISCETVGN